MVKGIIQAGGLGTRLHPITLEIPKPLLPIKRKPIIQYIVELFYANGIKTIFVLINKNDEEIFKKWKKEWNNKGVKLVTERERMGTWGGIQKFLAKELKETFVVSNGDELKEVDIKAMVSFHKKQNALATIASVRVKEVSDYGVLVSDRKGKVKQFLYKPQHAKSNFVMAGMYVGEPDLLDLVKKDTISTEEDIIPRLIEAGKLYEYKSKGRWFDCGTFRRYEEAIMNW